VQRAFFVEGDDVSDERTLRRVARESGLDPDGAVAAAWEPSLQARLRTIRGHAMVIGVHGVPALADDKHVFFGAPPPGAVVAALTGWGGDAAELAARLRVR
jgi:2-hydroxychromene-2-carboxylate isomerase